MSKDKNDENDDVVFDMYKLKSRLDLILVLLFILVVLGVVSLLGVFEPAAI